MQDEQAGGRQPAIGADSQAEEAAGQQAAAGARPGGPDKPAASGPPAPGTGEARVDEALARLGELPGLPVTEHPAVFEQVHRQLREVLGELDTGPPGAAAPGGQQRGPGG